MKRWLRHLPLPFALILLILAGVANYFKWSGWMPLTAFLLAALLIVAGLLAEIEGLGDIFRRRGARFGLSLFIASMLTLAIIVGINWTANRHFHRWDLTRTRMYSLSEQTRNILKRIHTPVRVIGFFTRENAANQDRFDDLIKEFQSHTSNLKVEKYDPIRFPTLASQYQITSGSTVVLSTKEKSSDKERFEKVQTVDEENLLAGLIRLLFPQKVTVCYVKGHGEYPLSEFGSPRAMNSLKQIAEKEQYEFREIQNFSPAEKSTCSLVMLVNPRYEAVEGEQNVLDEYLREGGRVWFFADTGLPPGWRNWLKNNGVTVYDDYLFDDLQAMFGGDPSVLQANTLAQSPISPQEPIPAILALAHSLEGANDTAKGYTSEILMQTLNTSWSDRNKNQQHDEGDVKGPLTVTLAEKFTKKVDNGENKENNQNKEDKSKSSEPEFKTEGRLVVSGDADWLTDNLIGLRGGVNAAIALNTLAWLSKRDVLISKDKPNIDPPRLNLTVGQLLIFRSLTVLFLPLAMFAAATAIWWRRRKL